MAKKSGVWGLQQVRDKQLQSLWAYSAFGDAGTLWSMGYNSGGILGLNDTNKRSSPTQIGSSMWKDIAGVRSNGTLWSWGYNGIGQLGQNNLTKYSSPVQIGSDTTWKNAYGLVSSSDTEKECFAIKTDGTLWAWGYNNMGQLGLNDAGGPGPAPSQRANSRSSPVQVGGDTTWGTSGHNKFGYSNGYGSLVAIKTDGTLWGWGGNWKGTLGQNSETYYSSPVQIPGTTWKSVSRGVNVGMMATKTDGTLWTWGYNEFGQLGHNNRTEYSSPTQIPGTTWNIVGGGVYNGSATKTDGTLWVWGYNLQGQLGQNDVIPGHTKLSSPVQVGTDTTWSRPIPLATYAMGAIKTDGTLWVWGEGAGGILGQNSLSDLNSPTQIPGDWIDGRGHDNVNRVLKG